jgi:hypothetical protein
MLRAPTWLRRLLWMFALWAAGVAALGVIVLLLRGAMHAVGMR